MKIKTSITEIKNNEEFIRGESLQGRATEHSFVVNIIHVLTGKKLSESEERLMSTILSIVIDHGPGTSSALNARISASSRNETHVALAAGLLGLGQRHGMAVTAAMEFFYDAKDEEDLDQLMATLKEAKVRVPGYGHKVFTDHDPRAHTLFQVATDEGVYGEYCVLALGVHAAVNKISSKQLPLNVDGAIAAILCDMGLDPALGNALFLIGRVPGLVAQILEEEADDVGLRRLSNDDIEFVA